MSETGENGYVGQQTRALEGQPAPEHHSLSAKQKLLAIAAGATLSALAFVGYKHGMFNSAEFEAKGTDADHTQSLNHDQEIKSSE